MEPIPVFDVTLLQGLRELIGETAANELVVLFHQLTRQRLATISGGSLDQVREAAHALKSGAGQLGALRLQALALQVERAAAQKQADEIQRLIPGLQAAYAELQPLLVSTTPAAPPPPPVTAPPSTDARQRLLIVEDNPDNRLLLRVLLSPHYHVSEFSDGDSTLAALDQAAPDLAILDISLPGMDGEELLARLRALPRWQRLPVIAFTAHAMAGDREHFLRAGFDAYIAKPITDEAILFDTIRRLLARA